MKKYLVVRDIVQITGFSAQKVRGLIRAGLLPAKNSSPSPDRPRYIVRESDLERFLTPNSERQASHVGA